jgi:hypothetical protein
MSRGISYRGVAGIAPKENRSRQAALLNSLWGREKIKFGHLRKTKDLAATSTETKDGNIAFLKPNCKPGPPPLASPKGVDRSIFLNSIQFFRPDFVWPVAGPATGRTTLSPALPSGRDDKGRPLMSVENMFCIRARLSAGPQPPKLTRALPAAEKPPVFEGYELQLVRKCLQTGPALAAEG